MILSPLSRRNLTDPFDFVLRCTLLSIAFPRLLHPSGFYPTSFENEADLTRDRDIGNEDNARVVSFPSRTPGDLYPRGAFALGVFPPSTSFAVISAVYDKVSFLWVVSTAYGAEARASNKKTGSFVTAVLIAV